MNKIVLLVHRFRAYWLRDKILVIMLVLANVICFLSLFLLYALYMPHLQINAEDNASLRFFSYDFSTTSDEYHVLFDIADAYHVQQMEVTGMIVINDHEYNYISTILCNQSATEYTPNLAYANLSENEILVDPGLSYQINETVPWNNLSMKVIGHTTDSEIVLSGDLVAKYNVPFDHVYFWTEEVVTTRVSNEISENIAQHFPVSGSMTGEDILTTRMSRNQGVIALFAIFYLFSMISFAYILSYMLERQSYNHWLTRVVGLSSRSSLVLSITEHLIFTFLTYLMAVLIHLLFWDAFFQKATTTGVNTFAFYDYLLLFFLVIVLSLVLFIPKYSQWVKTPLASSEGRVKNAL